MITLQFGQCGNQLGQCLFSNVLKDIEHKDTKISYDVDREYVEDALTKWFNECTKSLVARAILVDTERKVIDKICSAQTSPWSYSESNFIYQTNNGSANNWAYGYTTKLCDAILEAVRREAEVTDTIDAFLLLYSSAGGTGSGIGSYTIQALRDLYKTKPIIGGMVLPFSFGEVCTQKYNTLLNIGSFYDEIDMALVFQNEELYRQGKRLWKDTQLKNLNDIITQQMMAIFQPVSCRKWRTNRLVSGIASHPLYKLVEIESVMHQRLTHSPESSAGHDQVHTWSFYLKEAFRWSNVKLCLRNTSRSISDLDFPARSRRSVSNILITRGAEDETALSKAIEEASTLRACTGWTDSFLHLHHNREFFNCDKFVALLRNDYRFFHLLDNLLKEAWNSYIHGVFLHPYRECGLEDDDFLQIFAKIETVAKGYKELNRDR